MLSIIHFMWNLHLVWLTCFYIWTFRFFPWGLFCFAIYPKCWICVHRHSEFHCQTLYLLQPIMFSERRFKSLLILHKFVPSLICFFPAHQWLAHSKFQCSVLCSYPTGLSSIWHIWSHLNTQVSRTSHSQLFYLLNHHSFFFPFNFIMY